MGKYQLHLLELSFSWYQATINSMDDRLVALDLCKSSATLQRGNHLEISLVMVTFTKYILSNW